MIDFLSTPLGLTASVASPTTSGAVPRTLTFFFCFSSKVTEPVGTPPPGARGSIVASRSERHDLLLLEDSVGHQHDLAAVLDDRYRDAPDAEAVDWALPL